MAKELVTTTLGAANLIVALQKFAAMRMPLLSGMAATRIKPPKIDERQSSQRDEDSEKGK